MGSLEVDFLPRPGERVDLTVINFAVLLTHCRNLRQVVIRGFINIYPPRIRCHAEVPWNRAPTGRRILFVAEGGHRIEPRRAVRRQITGENGHGG